jgi:nucleoside-diphosphate-sugar epimerase
VTAERMRDDGWEEACRDCSYVLHVASPFPVSVPKNEDDLIVPAREGALRCLRFAKAAGTVKRVVMTSSTAAVSRVASSRTVDTHMLRAETSIRHDHICASSCTLLCARTDSLQ